MLKFDSLPQLAVGSHDEGSGQACIMNALSYLTGQATITDMPTCVWRPLAYLAQLANDNICESTHQGWRKVIRHGCLTVGPGADSPHEPEPNCTLGSVTLLCPSCTHTMWMLGARMIGSAESQPVTDKGKVTLAAALLRVGLDDVLDRGGCSMVIDGMRDMLDGKASPCHVKALHDRCLDEHRCSGQAGNPNVDLGYAASFVDAVLDLNGWFGREAWEDELVHQLRYLVADCLDLPAVLGKFIDAFEQATGFRALAPLPSDIKASAQRAGLALV